MKIMSLNSHGQAQPTSSSSVAVNTTPRGSSEALPLQDPVPSPARTATVVAIVRSNSTTACPPACGPAAPLQPTSNSNKLSGEEERTECPDEVPSPCARFPLTDIPEEDEQDTNEHKEDVDPSCAHNRKKFCTAGPPFACAASQQATTSSVPTLDWNAAASADQAAAKEQLKSLGATHGTAGGVNNKNESNKKRTFDANESDSPQKKRALNSSNSNNVLQQTGSAPFNPAPATLSTPAKASPPEEPNPVQSPPWLMMKETPTNHRKTSLSRKMGFTPHVWGDFFLGVFADQSRQDNRTAGTPSFDALADREDGAFPSKVVKSSMFKMLEDHHHKGVGKKPTRYNSIRGADKYKAAFGTSPFGFTVPNNSGGIEYGMPMSTLALGFVAERVSRGLVSDIVNKSGGLVRGSFMKTLLQKTRMHLPADHVACDTSFLPVVEKCFRGNFISRVAEHINEQFKVDGSALQTDGYTDAAFENFVLESVKAVFGIRWKEFLENSVATSRQSFVEDVKVQLRTVVLKAVVSVLLESTKTKAWGITTNTPRADEDLTSLMDYRQDFLTPFNEMLGGCDDCYKLNVFGFFGGGDPDKALDVFATAVSFTWKKELADLVARQSILLEWDGNEGCSKNALTAMGWNQDAAQRISQNKEFRALFEVKKKVYDGPGGAAHLQYLENRGKPKNSELVASKQESQLATAEFPLEGYIHSSDVRILMNDQQARHTEQLTKVERIHAESMSKKDATVIRNRELDMENKKLDIEREKVASHQRLESEKMMHDSAQKNEDRWAKLVLDMKDPGAQLQSPAPAPLGHSSNFAGPGMQSSTPTPYQHSTLQPRNGGTVMGFAMHRQPVPGAPGGVPAPTQPGGFAIHHQPETPAGLVAQTTNGSFWSTQPSAGACTSATANVFGGQPSIFGATQHSRGAFTVDASIHADGSNPAPEHPQQSSRAFTFRATKHASESITPAHGASQQAPGTFSFGAANHTFESKTFASKADDPSPDTEQS